MRKSKKEFLSFHYHKSQAKEGYHEKINVFIGSSSGESFISNHGIGLGGQCKNYTIRYT
jgi:hypothetical protein